MNLSPNQKCVPYVGGGFQLLIPSSLELDTQEHGWLRGQFPSGQGGLLVQVLQDEREGRAWMKRVAAESRTPDTGGHELVREGEVAVPYPGTELVRARPDGKFGPSFGWYLFVHSPGGPLKIAIFTLGLFEEWEPLWARVIQSIRVDPDALSAKPAKKREEVRKISAKDRAWFLKLIKAGATSKGSRITIPPRTGEPPGADVLAQLDASAGVMQFPALDHGYVFPADTRLSVYGDKENWAILIEVLGFNPRAQNHENLADVVYCFGNYLSVDNGLSERSYIRTTSDGPDGPTFDAAGGVMPDVRSIGIRKTVVPIRRDRKFLASKQIGPTFYAQQTDIYAKRQAPKLRKQLLAAAKAMAQAGDEFTGRELLRSLLPEHRQLLLASEEELNGFLAAKLPLLLRLDQWHHPDISAGELPSESEAFKMIAKVLATGDASWYKPRQKPNTHWSNWPMGGDL